MINLNLRPSIGALKHPIVTGNYTLRTFIINKLLSQMHKWVSDRTTGAIISGRQRLGKTQAMGFTIRMLKEAFPGITIIKVPCRFEKNCTERSFFSYLLQCSNHALYLTKRCEPNVYRHRLNEFLKMKAEKSEYPFVLLFLDDAQRLSESQYAWLMDVHNELIQAEIHLGCYLFGQPELLHQKSAFLMGKKMHLVSRFMLHEFKFHGIMNIKEARYCLESYDTMEFPEGSGWTFSAYFFPEAYSTGWRIACMSDDIWNAFVVVASVASVPRKMEIPMEYFTKTIERLFRAHENKNVHIDAITHVEIIEAINSTNFGDYRDGMQDDEP